MSLGRPPGNPNTPLTRVQPHARARSFGGSVASARPLYSTSPEPSLKETLRKIIPEKRDLLKQVKAISDKKLGDLKVENALGGMRWVRRNTRLQI
jgi:citrate synthase